MTTWSAIAAPPAPPGFAKSPALPAMQPIFTTSLPDTFSLSYGLLIGLELTVNAQWQKVLEGTSQPASPFNQQQSVTMGVSASQTDTTKMSAAFGCKDDLFSLGGSISKSVARTITLSASVTDTISFSVQNSDTPVTGVWWQLCYIYDVTGSKLEAVVGADGKPQPKEGATANTFSAQLSAMQPVYASSEYVGS